MKQQSPPSNTQLFPALTSSTTSATTNPTTAKPLVAVVVIVVVMTNMTIIRIATITLIETIVIIQYKHAVCVCCVWAFTMTNLFVQCTAFSNRSNKRPTQHEEKLANPGTLYMSWYRPSTGRKRTKFHTALCCAISRSPRQAHPISPHTSTSNLAFAVPRAPNFTKHVAVRSRNCRRKRTKFHKAVCCAISRSPRQAQPLS